MSWPTRYGIVPQQSKNVLYASGTNNVGTLDKNRQNIVLTPQKSTFFYNNITTSFVSTSVNLTEANNQESHMALLGSNKKCYLAMNRRQVAYFFKRGLTQFSTGSNWFKVENYGVGLFAIDGPTKNIWYANLSNQTSFTKLNTGSFKAIRGGSPLSTNFPSPTLIAQHTDGTLWARGVNTYGLMGNNSTVSYYDGLRKIGTSTWTDFDVDYHCVAVKSNGTLWGWGLGSSGELGQGDALSRSSPTQIGTGTTWTQVSVGRAYTGAVKSDGTLWMWGYNAYGQLGQNNTTNRSSPVQVGTGTDWSAVLCGNYYYTLAIKTDGTLWGWGRNDGSPDGEMFYQWYLYPLGTGDYSSRSSPVQISSQPIWTKNIARRTQCCVALTTDGVYTWGQPPWAGYADPNTIDANSDGYSNGGAVSPYMIDKTSDFIRVEGSRGGNTPTGQSSGCECTMGVKANGTLWSWGMAPGIGQNIGAQAGTRYPRTAYRSSPTQVGTGSNWTSRFSLGNVGGNGGLFPCHYFITSNNRLWRITSSAGVVGTGSWAYVASSIDQSNSPYSAAQLISTTGQRWYAGDGNQSYGEFGINSTTGVANIALSPRRADSNTDWKFVSGGAGYFLAIKTDGTLWGWGLNTNGCLGDGTNTNRSSPVQIGTGSSWAFVDASMNSSTMGITTTGQLWGWGTNTSGQLGDGTVSNKFNPTRIGGGTTWVSCSAGGSLMIKTDGTMWGTGFATGTSSPIQIGLGYNTWKNTHIGTFQYFYVGTK